MHHRTRWVPFPSFRDQKDSWGATVSGSGGPATDRDSPAHDGAARGRHGSDLSMCGWLVPAMSCSPDVRRVYARVSALRAAPDAIPCGPTAATEFCWRRASMGRQLWYSACGFWYSSFWASGCGPAAWLGCQV